jgi:hypothetical protein
MKQRCSKKAQKEQSKKRGSPGLVAQSIKSTILKPEEPQGKFIIYEWPIRARLLRGG